MRGKKRQRKKTLIKHQSQEKESLTGSTQRQDSNISSSISGLLIRTEIAVIGLVIIYIYCYTFFLGYYHYFKIPTIYFEITITKLTMPSYSLFFIFLVISFPSWVFYSFRKNSHLLKERKKRITTLVIIVLIISIIMSVKASFDFFIKFYNLHLNNDGTIQLIYAYISALVVSFYVIDPQPVNKDSKMINSSNIFYLIVIIFAFFACAYFMGTLTTFKSKHPVLFENKKSQQKIILDTYKDFYVVSKYIKTKKGHQLTGEIELIEVKKGEKTNPIKITKSQGISNMTYEEKNITVKEISIPNLLPPE